jgi:tetratricopeptide (TPR) repeat protein
LQHCPSVTRDLADSLHNFGVDLHHIGCHKDAVQVGKEAVRLYRKLAKKDPSVTTDLANLLHNLGIDLYAIGHHQDAVQADEEAVRLRRKLAKTDPLVTEDLANSLHNLGEDLRAIGHHQDAVQIDKEAVRLRTRPVKAEAISCQLPLLNPDVFEHVNTVDSAIVAKLVYLLQDQVLYKRLLACHRTNAQTLLDLLQDLSYIMILLPGEYYIDH